MMNYHLIKFTHKYEARQILRQLGKSIKHSSIYAISHQQYLLIQESIHPASRSRLPPLKRGISSQTTISNSPLEGWCADVFAGAGMDALTTDEELLYQWAKSEVEDSLSFIRYESESKYVANGRSLTATNGEVVIRSFAYLSDIFGIVNCTVDSFSDGGKYNSLNRARERIISLVNSGCAVIDIGVESTRPDAISLTSKAELQILHSYLPMLMELKQELPFQLSIDTYHPETIKSLIEQDINFINDVSGNLASDIVAELVKTGKKYIAMHSLDVPARKDNILDLTFDPITYLSDWALAKMNEYDKYGINQEQIVFDPGIGFANNSAQAWYIIRNLDKFNCHGAEVLLGHSRKSLFSHLSDTAASQRDLVSGALAAMIASKVDYLRLHDLNTLNEIYPVIEFMSDGCS